MIIFGNWLIICGGWFEDLLIYDNKSFGFLYIIYVPLFKLHVLSKKSKILRLVSTSMAKAISLNILIIFFHIRSICWPFTFRNMSSASSLYRPQCFLLISFTKNIGCKYQLPILTSNQLSVCLVFFYSSLLLNSKDLQQNFINLICLLDMSWCCFTNSEALSIMVSVMNG